ncbi:conjugal transfer protein TrbL [Streptococcus sp. S784/96/1]|uniref:conjugal transfer protein TrbL n=1 Tax=Streptococcus sp. S784/96/1 TaxID=2653499 RepID=UPI001386AB24|nr:conjugal transfer protein TrbL [Streptococcus sp. S784/96/1]
MDIDYTDFSKSLPEFGPTADRVATAANKSLLALGFILLGIFFLIEMMSWHQHMKSRGNSLTKKMWLEIALKYLFTFVLIIYSAELLDGINWLLNTGVKIVLRGVQMINPSDFKYEYGTFTIKGMVKGIINTVGQGTEIVARVVVVIVNFLRYLDQYVLKAMAPVLVACFMSDALRSISLNFFKRFASYGLIALLMVLVSIVYPALITDDLLKLAVGEASGVQLAILSIAKGVIYIISIVGTGRKAQQLLGV